MAGHLYTGLSAYEDYVIYLFSFVVVIKTEIDDTGMFGIVQYKALSFAYQRLWNVLTLVQFSEGMGSTISL